MQVISLPKANGYIVVKDRIISPTHDGNDGVEGPCIGFAMKRPDNTNYGWDHFTIPYHMEPGEWYAVHNVIYPRKSWKSYGGKPWLSLTLHRSKRRWVRDKVDEMIAKATAAIDTQIQYSNIRINSIKIDVPASLFNGKMYWVETELEAKQLSSEILTGKTNLVDTTNERWTELKEDL